MTVKIHAHGDKSQLHPLDAKATDAAERIATKHGLLNRARNTWFAMATELLGEIQPAMQDQARADADTAAKTRLKEILGLDEAHGHREMAEKLALETDTSIEQCKSILASVPRPKPTDPLASLMPSRSPGVSSDDGVCGFNSETEETEAAAQYILNAGKAK